MSATLAPPSSRRARRGWFVFTLIAVAAAVGGWRWYQVTGPEYRFARGEEALRAKDWSAATHIIDQLEAAGATNHAAVLRGEYFLATGRPDLALSAYNQVTVDGPLRLQAAAGSGRSLIELGNLAEAHRVLSYVLDANPDHLEARRGMAALAYDLGQLPDAVGHLQEVARLAPTDPRPHRLIGLIDRDLNLLEEAEAAYREALRREPEEPTRGEVVVELADTLNRAKKYSDALAALDLNRPAPGPAGKAAGVEALRGVGRRTDAVSEADRAVGAYPADGRLHRLRGQLHLDDANALVAVASLETAASKLPADYQTQFLLAQAYSAAGRSKDAARTNARAEELRVLLEKATKLTREAMEQPWDITVRLELATVSESIGEPKLAEMWRSAAAACRSHGR
jgi:predicted Zn-dependent protease